MRGLLALARGDADGAVDLDDLLGGGGQAGADGPDGLIGDAEGLASQFGGERAPDLPGDDLQGLAGLALLQGLAHAAVGCSGSRARRDLVARQNGPGVRRHQRDGAHDLSLSSDAAFVRMAANLIRRPSNVEHDPD